MRLDKRETGAVDNCPFLDARRRARANCEPNRTPPDNRLGRMVAEHSGRGAGTGTVFRGKDERRVREISRQAEGRNRDLSGADGPLPAQAGESQWRDPSPDASAPAGEGAARSTVTFCGVGGTGARAK